MLKLIDLSRLGMSVVEPTTPQAAARPRFSPIPREERFFDPFL